MSEIHGMSQRGGSVVTHVRYGTAVHSPVIEAGMADVVMGLELLEAARYAPMLRRDGLLIANTQEIHPLPVLTGAAAYPAGLVAHLAELPIRVVPVDGLAEARAAGSVRAVNTVLVGVLARMMGTADATRWREAVVGLVKEAHREVNLTAFQRGFALGTALGESGAPRCSRGVKLTRSN